jgi:hypothetical protein
VYRVRRVGIAASRPMATKQRGALTDLDCNFNKLIFNATVCLAASAAGAAFDSLRLAECGGVAPPPLPVLAPLQFESSSQALRVVASGAHTAPGEFSTISAALAWRRSHVSSQPILLLRGTHFLAAPLKLGAADSGLQLLGEPGALLSGGVPLSDLISRGSGLPTVVALQATFGWPRWTRRWWTTSHRCLRTHRTAG